MTSPQQPELRRSGRSAVDPKADKAHADAKPHDLQQHSGAVPPDNQPGHHPDHEQDQPDVAEMAAKLGIESDDAA
jgi:hypothetical protein